MNKVFVDSHFFIDEGKKREIPKVVEILEKGSLEGIVPIEVEGEPSPHAAESAVSLDRILSAIKEVRLKPLEFNREDVILGNLDSTKFANEGYFTENLFFYFEEDHTYHDDKTDEFFALTSKETHPLHESMKPLAELVGLKKEYGSDCIFIKKIQDLLKDSPHSTLITRRRKIYNALRVSYEGRIRLFP